MILQVANRSAAPAGRVGGDHRPSCPLSGLATLPKAAACRCPGHPGQLMYVHFLTAPSRAVVFPPSAQSFHH
jgi:hypothetical protein